MLALKSGSRRFLFSSPWRVYSTQGTTSDIRDVLQARVKDAMRAKDKSTSTTLRSILAEINAADKTANDKVSSSTIVNIIRKAAARRHDAAAQYTQANRPDIADKELAEASLLEEFLPPLLSSVEVDRKIQDVLASLSLTPSQDLRKETGKIFKEFYNQVDRSLVDPQLVKDRLNLVLNLEKR
ncbi:Yqey-like protein-domain-containing protein [Lentinula raphanica]|uniref:Altered inheritance of mitochondria protein 41 n=1 Tax=Lentinula raphanica TaxID=153919 RepID=A0AA38P4N5_9AGAR|nr:Yqey-like protein-domain-containing protein [Lentinula raphanica]KAJ3836257.1 Yqey-like protein-domain-containing protein [Lentinula raphanica]KAJ3968483.1 Yqey-like protein-domain-containing protein [Lentinula raphanica]